MQDSESENITLREKIIGAVKGQPEGVGPSDIAKSADSTANSVSQELSRMLDDGIVERIGHGKYVLSKNRNNDPGISYPVADGSVAAGKNGGVQYVTGKTMTLARDVVASWNSGKVPGSDEAYWTRVRGTSMEPWLVDGTPLFVVCCAEVEDGGRYVLWLDDAEVEVVKRVQRRGGNILDVISDHPAHPSMRLRALGDDDLYTDLETGETVRLRVRGRVVYPADTAHAILKTFAMLVRE